MDAIAATSKERPPLELAGHVGLLIDRLQDGFRLEVNLAAFLRGNIGGTGY
jgi:hypothetical protein